jgi:flagellar P-ring protein precursor FlgI
MTLSLNDPDMNTAISIARNINDSVIDNLRANQNRAASVDVAKAIGPGRVDVTIPKAWHGREAEFRHLIENVSVNPDTVAKVTIHRKTGDFVITGNVRVKPGAVSVGGVSISTTPQGALPAQPAPGSVVTDPIIPVNQPDASLMDFLSSLNALNLTKEEKAQLLRNLATDKLLIGKFEDKD